MIYEFAVYDSARVHQGGLDASLGQAMGNEERYTAPMTNRGVSQHGDYSTNLSEPSGVGHSKIGLSSGMEEEPFAPNPTRMASPIGITDHTHGMISKQEVEFEVRIIF